MRQWRALARDSGASELRYGGGMYASAIDVAACKPPSASPLRAGLIFAATSLLSFTCLYVVLPFLRQMNANWFVCLNLVLSLPMFALVGLAFWANKHEGYSLRWPMFRDRFRLGSMDVSSWIWTASLAAFMFGGRYADLTAVSVAFVAIVLDRKLTQRQKFQLAALVSAFVALSYLLRLGRPFFVTIPLHYPFPHVLQEFLAHLTAPDSFMGIAMRGHWWIAVYYAVVLVFGNIAGEELWWRGYLLPRQELRTALQLGSITACSGRAFTFFCRQRSGI